MQQNRKEDFLPALVFFTSALLSMTSHTAAVVCPNVSVESGSSLVISCKSDRVFSYYYWYRGQPSSTPILILDNAGKGGYEYDSEHFDISSNGSMILKNVTVEHESYYSFVGYYGNGLLEKATFLVNVTVSPDHPCPLIHECSSCTECNVSFRKEVGTLTCEIKGSRPALPLSWEITSQTGVTFVKYHQVEQRNAEIGTSDTSISLDYTITYLCGFSAEVTCVAEDPSQILQWSASTIKMRKAGLDSCNNFTVATIPADENAVSTNMPSLKSVLVVVFCSLAVVCVVSCLTIIVYSQRRHRTILRGGAKETFLFLLPYKEAKVKLLVRSLKEAYHEQCKLKPLPWENIYIPVGALYTECLFKWPQNKTISSAKLVKSRKIREAKRVIVIGEHGHGRTTFTKYLVHKWIKDSQSSCLLIYIRLREVMENMKLSDVVRRDLTHKTALDTEEIEKVLTCGKLRCLVILDGFEDLSKSCDENMTDTEYDDDQGEEKNMTNDKVTIGELLKGNLKDHYTNLYVWVTSCEVAYMTSELCSKPAERVDIIGFSEEQILKYIKACCDYYNNRDFLESKISSSLYDCEPDSVNLHEDMNEGFGRSLNNESSRINQKVVNFLKENDIFDDFKTTPLIRNIIIHVMVINYTSGINDTLKVKSLKNTEIKNINTLMRVVIGCMEERYVQKNGPSEIDFSVLEKKLGEVVFQHNGQLVGKGREFWIDQFDNNNLNTAMEIGLLRLSQSVPASNTEMTDLANTSSTLEFYHQHIQDFLVARYLVDSTDCFQTILDKLQCADNKGNKVFIFMSGSLQESRFQHLCETLKTHHKYDMLIDCLYENGNYDILQKILKNSGDVEIHINHLKSLYHRKAVRSFCKKCKELKIELCSVSFTPNGDNVLPYLKNLLLPTLKRVELCQMEVTETDFAHICRWLSEQQVTGELRFRECTLPEETFEGQSRTEEQSTVTYFFDKESRRWKRRSSGTPV